MYFSDFPIIRSESRMPLYLFTVGLHECQPHTIRREGYSYPQLFYCTKGSGTLELDGKKIMISPYTAFFLPAGYPHEYYPNEELWDIRWIAPAGSAVDELLEHFGLDRPKVFAIQDIKTLEHHFRQMHEALVGDSIFGNYRAAGYLYDFLIEFYRLISSGDGSGTTNSAVIRATDYINAHYTEDISMEQLCKTAGVSKQHLCRLFRTTLSSRPMEYIAKRRIQAAKELLTQTELSVEDIAEKTGFCTASYFTKLFRRYEGITPSQFRRG